jgi:hypothetical protein
MPEQTAQFGVKFAAKPGNYRNFVAGAHRYGWIVGKIFFLFAGLPDCQYGARGLL